MLKLIHAALLHGSASGLSVCGQVPSVARTKADRGSSTLQQPYLPPLGYSKQRKTKTVSDREPNAPKSEMRKRCALASTPVATEHGARQLRARAPATAAAGGGAGAGESE